VSDEEDGDDEAFQSPFENFSSTAPRFSVMLEQHQLSFEEESETSPTQKTSKKSSPVALVEPKHEKRDSGIAGLESENVKILDHQKVKVLDSSQEDKSDSSMAEPKKAATEKPEVSGCKVLDDDEETEGEDNAEGEDGESTENEDATGIVTNIDDDVSDSDDKNSVTPPSSASLPHLTTPSVSIASKPPANPTLLSTEQPLPPSASSPVRPMSDYSSLVRAVEPQSATLPRPISDHGATLSALAMLPPGSSNTAPRLGRHSTRRRHARMEDMSKLSNLTRELDITVSPPTPGKL